MYSALLHGRQHTFTLEEPVVIPLEYLGELGPGATNLTRRDSPPIKPQPELEQGVGRAPVNAWAHMEHTIHDNPDWYLGVGALFQPADLSLQAGGSVRTPIPVAALIALNYYQNHEAQSVPGVTSPVTVPAQRAVTETRRSVIGP